MSKLHYLYEYQFALKVTKEVPNAIENIDKCLKLLYDYKEYIDVAKSIKELEDSKAMLEIILETYKQLVKRKGAQ